ncbi:Translation initiation factor IF-2 [Streptomyces tendae]
MVNANPASLVAVMMNLGEMVTANQSVSDETLQLLADEMNYTVQIVNPEEEAASCSSPSTWSSARTRAPRRTWSSVRRS